MGEYDELIDQELGGTAPAAPPTPKGTTAVPTSEYDALIDEELSSAPLHRSLNEAVGTNPDEEAKKLRLSKDLNLPGAILPADAEQQAEFKKIGVETMRDLSPSAAMFLTNPDNALVTGVAGVQKLVDTEKTYKTYSPENIKRYIERYTSTGKPAAEAVQQLSEMKKRGENLADVLDPYARNTPDYFTDPVKAAAGGANIMAAGFVEMGEFAPQQRVINKLIDAVTPKRKEAFNAVQETLNENLDYWQGQKSTGAQKMLKDFNDADTADSVMMLMANPSLVADQLAQSSPYLLPGAAAARGGKTAMLVFKSAIEAADAANSARQEAIQAGRTPEEQDRAAITAAVITAPFVFLGNKLTGVAGLEAEFLTKGRTGYKLLSAMVREAISGAVEEGSNQFGVNVARVQYDDTRGLLDGVGKAAVIGGLLEGTHAVGMTTAERALNAFVKDAEKLTKVDSQSKADAAGAVATHNTMEDLGLKAAESDLRERSPEAFKEFVDTMTDGQELQDVYVDGAATLAAVTESFPELRVQQPEIYTRIEEAAALGHDVQLSVGEYLTHFAGSAAEPAVLPALKSEPGGATFKEAQEFYKQQTELFQQEVTSIAEQNEPVMSREEFEAQKVPTGNYLANTEDKGVVRAQVVRKEGGTAIFTEDHTYDINNDFAAGKSDEELIAYFLEPLGYTGLTAPTEMPATYEEYVAQHKNQREVYAKDVDGVESTLVNEFQNAGRFTSSVNKAYVAPLLEFYKTQAKNFGIAPSEMYSRFPLRIQTLIDWTPGTGEVAQTQPTTLDDFRSGNLNALLQKNDWVIMPPENPKSEPTPEQNPARIATFTEQLVAEDIGFYPVIGKYVNMENSFILFGVTPEQALALGKQYDQDSVLTKDGFIYQDGTRNPSTGVITEHETAPEDLFTTITFPDGTQTMFTVGVDVKTTLQPGEMAPVPVERIGDTAPAKGLSGLPTSSVGPSGEVQRTAEAYMASAGLPYNPPSAYVQADPERGARIAKAYEEMVDAPTDPEVRAAYEALAKETMAQYQALKALGYTFDFIQEGQPDPYTGGPREALLDMKNNKHLWVYPTTSGYGDTGATASDTQPMLRPTGETLNGQPMLVNDVFRVVHDVFGHAKDGVGFGATGEENARQSHVRMFSPLAARAMTSETRGQNSWVNFGPFGEQNRNNQRETIYAPQKLGLLPEWVSTEGVEAGALNQSGKVGQVTIRGIHLSHAKRATLSSAFRGTGIKASEDARTKQSDDPRIRQRIDFYVDEGRGIFPEYGLGKVKHVVTMTNLYDGSRNPLKLPTQNADGVRDMNIFESAVIDAGFDGYYVNGINSGGVQGRAVLLGDASRAVKPDGAPITEQDTTRVKERFAEELKNPDIEAEYNARPDALNGKVLNTDVARELSSDYLANRSFGATVHEQSNKFIKKLYAKRLAEAPKGNELPVVLFTAGGTGAGKTSAILQGDPTALDRKQIVYDTNMATYESSKQKVEQALAAGKAVDIILTVRDPIDGFINGALKRAMRQGQEFGTGRAVPILNHASTYLGAPVTVQRLAEDYKGDPRVSVVVLDNSFGKNNAIEISVADANKYVYNSKDELEQILMEVLIDEYEKGTISEAVARATAHTSRGDETNRIRPKRNDQGDSQGAQQPGVVYQSVSTRTPSAVGSEDPHLTSGLAVGLESLDKAPALKAKVAKIVSGYMTFKKGPKTTEAIIESFLQQTEANLLWVYDQVPEALRARSKKWYEGGSLVADRWVDKYQGRYTKAQMAAALAVMSPTMPWDINISLSERLVDIYTNNQDSAWDEGMTRVADSIAENNPNRKMLLDATRGKTLAEVEGTEAKGAWMRIYDEAHNPRSYRLPTPEGGFGDIAMTKSGKPSSVAYINGFGPIAKVVSVLQNGNMENISRQLGEAHKVRNFYNNLFDPTDATSVTIDTHAVAVGLLLPLGASSIEVMNALNGTGGKNAEQGLTGTYSLFAEAYRRAAQARGVLPREMQSITWEAGRGLFNPAFKSAHQKNPAKLKAIWDDFTSGKADIDETRDRIREAAGGIQEPAWTKYDAGLYEGAPASSYTSDVLGAGGLIGTTTGGYGSGTTGGVSVNQGTRGSFNLDTLTMTLLNGSDLSTVIHESGHFYLKMLQDLATSANAPQQVKDDYLKALAWFGVEQDAWQRMTLEEQRPYHEQWAESFELWNLEGKAPTQQLQPVFSRFRAWLLSVYKSVEDFLRLHPAAGKLNDEVRGVFSRLLASAEAIEATEQARAYQPLFGSAEEAGVSAQAFSDYVSLGTQATANATDELQARSLRDMKWLTNARSKALKALQSTAKEARAKVMGDVANEVSSEPIYQAQRFLRTGETKDPNTGEFIKAMKGFRLDTGILAEMYPDTALDNPDLSKLRGMTSSEGLDPDIVAKMFGFRSGDALVRELSTAENMRDKIVGLTDQRMLEQHGDLVDEQSMQRAADEAVHNDARARFMATGLKMLSKSSISVSQMVKAAKEAAQNVIANKRVRDVKPKQYTAAESRANKQVLKLVAKQPAQAAEQQRIALLNNRLAAAAQDAVTEVEKALRYLGKFNNEGTRKNLDLEYLEQIDALLEPFDLRKGLSLRTIDARTTLAEWVQNQEAMGFEPTIDPVAVAEARQKSFKNMTMAELRALLDTIKQIEHMGRMKKKLLTAIEKAEFAERIAEAKLSIALNANRVVEERGTPADTIGFLGQWVRQMQAAHRKFASLMRELDGGWNNGALFNLLVRPMATAGNTETEMKAKAAERIGELFAPIASKISSFGNLYARRRVIPGTSISLTHEERVMFAMNWGNEGNRQRLLDGGITGKKAMSAKEAEAVLGTLTKEEWDFVQGVWDFIAEYRPLIEAQERELTGKTPEWVEPAEVQTKFGTYRGGYFPAKYDAVLSTRSDALEAVTDLRLAMKGAFGSAAARNGYTKARASQVVGRPLLLNFNAISRHVNEVVHRLAWQAWLIDAGRISRALDTDFRTHLGAEATKAINDTIRDIAQGDAPATGPFEVFLNRIRTGTSIVGMGWRITTALMQPTGIAQSISRVGSRHMTTAIARFIASPLESSDWVNEHSVLMRNRGRTMNREMNEILNTVRAGEKVSAITASFFYLTGKLQRSVDIPTYIGAYEKALEDMQYEMADSEPERQRIEASAHAIAGQTVLDTQGGGELKDLAQVQRGSPIFKLFTNFYSYMSTVYNLNVENYRRTHFKNPSEFGVFVADTILVNFVPVVLAVALKNALKGHCDWDDVECLAGRYKSEQVSHVFGQMVGLREIGVAADALTGGEAYGYSGPAGLRFFTDAYKAAEQLHQGEADMALFKSVNNMLGALFHYPAGQLNATIEGAIAIENGEVEGAAILPALIAGPPK